MCNLWLFVWCDAEKEREQIIMQMLVSSLSSCQGECSIPGRIALDGRRVCKIATQDMACRVDSVKSFR